MLQALQQSTRRRDLLSAACLAGLICRAVANPPPGTHDALAGGHSTLHWLRPWMPLTNVRPGITLHLNGINHSHGPPSHHWGGYHPHPEHFVSPPQGHYWQRPRAWQPHHPPTGLHQPVSVTLAAECDWEVHYGVVQPGHDHSVATHEQQQHHHGVIAMGGIACLNMCCHDPLCKGLEMQSRLRFQCTKFNKIPHGLTGKGQPIQEFMRQERPEAWSTFVKAHRKPGAGPLAVVVPTPPPHHAVQQELELDRKLRGVQAGFIPAPADAQAAAVSPGGPQPAANSCNWTVFYGMWIPLFQREEYEHGGALGGRHCMEVCCHDPGCSGLAIESRGSDQCYKYSHVPTQVHSALGVPFGDGRWLDARPQAWSIFVKADRLPPRPPHAPPPAAAQQHPGRPLGAPQGAAHQVPAKHPMPFLHHIQQPPYPAAKAASTPLHGPAAAAAEPPARQTSTLLRLLQAALVLLLFLALANSYSRLGSLACEKLGITEASGLLGHRKAFLL